MKVPFSRLLRKFFSASAVFGIALCAAVQPASANAPVRFDIYQSSGMPAVGSYGPLIGTFYSPDINFGSAVSWYWTPLGQTGDFAAVVTGNLNVGASGTYTFSVGTDDGSVLTIDGSPVINAWFPTAPATFSGNASLTAGTHAFRIDYFECCGNPASGLEMGLPSGVSFAGAVPEPETYAMLLAGLGLLGFTARRRKGVSRQAA